MTVRCPRNGSRHVEQFSRQFIALHFRRKTPLDKSGDISQNKCSAVAEMGDRMATKTWAENWGGCIPLGAAGSPSDTMWPGPSPPSVPSGILIHPAVWPQ